MKNNLDDQDKTIVDKKTEYSGGSANAGWLPELWAESRKVTGVWWWR